MAEYPRSPYPPIRFPGQPTGAAQQLGGTAAYANQPAPTAAAFQAARDRYGWEMGQSAAAAPPTVAPVTGKGLGSRIKEAYNAASQRAGRHLSWDDPTVILIWQVLAGLTPEQAQQASRKGAEYAHRNGRLLSDAEVDQLVSETKTAMPSQFDPAYGAGQSIQAAFQDVQAEFPGDTLQGNDPRLLAAIRRDPQLTGLTDEQIAQIIQTGRQFTHATGLMAGAGLDQAVGAHLKRSIPLPHQMSPGAFDQIQADPVSKALFDGALGRRGYDPASYYGQHLAARPKGTAPRTGSVARQIAGIV